MKEIDVYRRWDRFWGDFSSVTFLGKLSMKLSTREVGRVLKKIRFPSDGPIVEVGCGSGRVLKILKGWGYTRAIGIDNSPKSIELCCCRGLAKEKDVFLMDATDTSFPDAAFPMVFAEGVLEHFLDFSPLVEEMCRISSKYVLLVQPNHYSLLGRLSHFLQERVLDNVREYSYRWEVFRDSFAKRGFDLELKKNTPLGDLWILLFVRNNVR